MSDNKERSEVLLYINRKTKAGKPIVRKDGSAGMMFRMLVCADLKEGTALTGFLVPEEKRNGGPAVYLEIDNGKQSKGRPSQRKEAAKSSDDEDSLF